MGRRILIAAAVFSALLLGACGFTPLYATPGVSPGLSAIQVEVPHGRIAFLLGQALDDAFAHNREAPPLYKMTIKVAESTFPRGLTINNVAERYESHVRVTYELTELSTGKVIKNGVTAVEVTYAATDQPYAGIASQQDAQQRAADEAAQRMRIELATFFADRAKTP